MIAPFCQHVLFVAAIIGTECKYSVEIDRLQGLKPGDEFIPGTATLAISDPIAASAAGRNGPPQHNSVIGIDN